jgi:hypothetical protein
MEGVARYSNENGGGRELMLELVDGGRNAIMSVDKTSIDWNPRNLSLGVQWLDHADTIGRDFRTGASDIII